MRYAARYPVEARVGERHLRLTVLDVASGGIRVAGLEAAAGASPGVEVVVTLLGRDVAAEIVWMSSSLAGLRFAQALSPRDVAEISHAVGTWAAAASGWTSRVAC